MNRSTVVVVGLGPIGRALFAEISPEYEIIGIDRRPDAPTEAEALRPGARVVVGDATSRLVLEDAGVGEAEMVVLATASERVNLEIARLLREHFRVPRVISVGITASGIQELTALKVEVEDLFLESARAIRNRIERKARVAHGIGLGRNEILEVELHPNSRLVGKRLDELSSVRWRLGLVYRDGRIVVPGPETRLLGRDRLVILGEPSVLKTVSEILAFRFQRFPLEFGQTVTAYVEGREDEAFYRELQFLLEAFPLERLVILRPTGRHGEAVIPWEGTPPPSVEERQIRGHALQAIREHLAEDPRRPGFLVLHKESVLRGGGPLAVARRREIGSLARDVGSPVLLAAGSFPYKRVAVPCLPGVNVRHTLESVLEMTPSLDHATSALFVQPSKYLAAEEALAEQDRSRVEVSEMGLMYNCPIQTSVLEGNPVHALTEALSRFDLAVMDTSGWTFGGWLDALLNPDPVWHLVRRASPSILLVPPGEEAL